MRNSAPETSAEPISAAWAKSMPKNFMIPWLLLLIKQWSSHGYFLLQSLNQMGFTSVDHATLYKELRNLEKQGLVTSFWDTQSAGPAKRVYEITEAGERLLGASVDVVAGYQKLFSGFFDLYASVANPVPAPPAPAVTNSSKSKRGAPKGAQQGGVK